MEDEKILITWKTKLENGYTDKRQIVCNSERSARFLYDELTKKEKTIFIEMEYLTDD